MRPIATLRRLLLCATAITAAGATPLFAQGDSVTVSAGAHYRAGALKSWLLGADYRDLWATPLRVPVLDLSSFEGGLTPVQRGSGLQTRSLRFRARDGREFNFRSVDKDQTGGLHPDFQNTLIDRIAQDQVSSKHPSAALITQPLLEAAGILHPVPRLFSMPDDPRLGEFRQEFAGMLGFIEIHPDDEEGGGPVFAGAEAIASAERLLEHVEESPENRADSRAFLRARLFDLLVGDWDRHIGQWRWARFDRDGVRWWSPVPEDRDNAFSDADGALLALVRGRAPHLVKFGASYPGLYGLTANAQILDRRLLSDLPREAFDSIAADLQARLTDPVIARAIANAPPEYRASSEVELAGALRARRDALRQVATDFYDLLASEVEVRATDEAELAVVERREDGGVEVRLHAGLDPSSRVYFRRRFLPGETREVRVYLQGGDDRGVVRGTSGSGILVRLIGGGGDDTLADSATVSAGGQRTAFYDDRGDNTFVRGAGTHVDPREFPEPETRETGFNEHSMPYRDWGSEVSLLNPSLEWRYNVGPVIGMGPVYTRYGFRRVPHAERVALRALYAPLDTKFGLELAADFRRTNSRSHLTVLAQATQLAVTRFHGYGNETPAGDDVDRFKVWQTELRLAPTLFRTIADGVQMFVGPMAYYTSPESVEGVAEAQRPLGIDAYGAAGAQLGALVDTRDLPSFPTHGWHAYLRGSGFPLVRELSQAFGSVDAGTATYLPLPLESTLALRVGGRVALGDFPFQEAAYLGGPASLRGFPYQRFAGEGAAFGGAELRTFLTRFNFISRGDLGVILAADAGRVFVDGESSDLWHSSVGGGLWVGILDRTRTFSAVFAHGEQSVLYLALGMPF